jgi:predicted short-subunit dehydrogenase-like oxidoreductase (DUF2520 family)
MLQGTTNISQVAGQFHTTGKQTGVLAIERAAHAFSDIGYTLQNTLREFTKALRDTFVQLARQLTASMRCLASTVVKLTALLRANQVTQSTQRTDSILVCFKWGHPNVLGTDMPSMRMCNPVQLTPTLWRRGVIGVPGNVSRERMVVAQYTVSSLEEWVRLR